MPGAAFIRGRKGMMRYSLGVYSSTDLGGRWPMPTDYDAPRVQNTDDGGDESLEDLAARRRGGRRSGARRRRRRSVDPIDLPDIDLSGEELTVRVVPKQADEFTCSSCFLVQHHSRLALQSGDRMVCADCV